MKRSDFTPSLRVSAALLRAIRLSVGALSVSLAGAAPPANVPPIVAVFQLQDTRVTGKLSAKQIDDLTDYFATKLSEGVQFRLVPTEDLRKALQRAKTESYRACYSDECQIEIGKELAAEKTISTKIISLAENECSIVSRLYDLESSVTDRAASRDGKCDRTAIAVGLREVAEQLKNGSPPIAEAPNPSVAPDLPQADIEWIKSRPARVWFGKTEVTVAQYRRCVEAGACEAAAFRSYALGSRALDEADSELCNYGAPDRDDHPMNCVSFAGAEAFCGWVGARLPSDAEWLAEASNGGERKYPWGDEEAACDRAIQFGRERFGCDAGITWPVCSRPRGNSISGLCDLSGNVREWVSFYPNREERFVRGGCLTAAGRLLSIDYPAYEPATKLACTNGFRCVRDAR